jgi:hypothetical protein
MWTHSDDVERGQKPKQVESHRKVMASIQGEGTPKESLHNGRMNQSISVLAGDV